MSAAPDFQRLHVNRRLDLDEIEAVGFDLDHTLALYDDHALNVLATAETVEFLGGHRGYAPDLLRVATDPIPAARGLSLDLRHGNVLKIAADRTVLAARRGDAWVDARAIREQYREHDPACDSSTWHIHSPFDEPTLWFFAALAPRIDPGHDAGTSAKMATLLGDIRAMLDRSHTTGELKRRVLGELDRFVRPAGGVREGLERWARGGKRLFVVTNSDRAFATAVLDRVLGGLWRELFALVVTGAEKPSFFAAPRSVAARPGPGSGHVIEGGSARGVESILGVPATRVLYIGDNARSDVAPARAHGWRTAHVVAELAAATTPSPWGGALEHNGVPTWFARVIREEADVVCARADRLLALEPSAVLDADSGFFARLRSEAP